MNIVISEPLGVSGDTLEALAKEKLGEGFSLSFYDSVPKNDEEYIERCREAEMLILANNPLGKSVIDKLPKLKYVSVAFTGVDHVDIEACRARGIKVGNCAGYSTPAVAELAIGLMISVYRHIAVCDDLTRTGGTRAGYIGRELYGKTLGIVGTGAIGLQTASIAKAFGMNVTAYSRTKRKEAVEMGIVYKDIAEIFSESDIVSVHVPLNDSTRGLVSKELIDLMKPSAVLINTARGPIIDNDALAAALSENRLSGAGIDVFEVEPPIPTDHPLFGAPNVTVLPHVAFATHESMDRRAIIAFDNLAAYMEGNPINVIV